MKRIEGKRKRKNGRAVRKGKRKSEIQENEERTLQSMEIREKSGRGREKKKRIDKKAGRKKMVRRKR